MAQIEFLEMTERMAQFRDLSQEQRALHLGTIAASRCNDKEANLLFDRFCREIREEDEAAFFSHIGRCAPCNGVFLRLIWLSTDFDGH